MKKKIRILAVEDSQDDALLLARTLRESGYDPHLVRVDTAEALSEALETAEWDIVFADYFLRNVRGLDALRLIEEKGLDLPLIIVSRVIGEDVEVSAMKAGARDWISKDNLARLPISVDRAIEEASARWERRKLEEQLRQAQKMEAVGLLAGGIAHDFNNILTAIIGYGSLLRSLMSADDSLRVYVDQILTASNKAATLTQSLLAFSRKQVLNIQPLDVNTVIENVGQLLSRIMGEDIDLRIDLHHDPLHVMADRGQLEQVLMNLATNSRDVMPQGGQFRITTEVMEYDPPLDDAVDYREPGRYVVISVTDSGSGMDENVKQRIFEPFFTTKEADKGTGLGLAIVYGIVKQHSGHIEVDSTRNEGTTFRLYLPLVDSQAGEKKPGFPTGLPAGGSETILVAEDSDAVRSLIGDVLVKSGYRVIQAKDGEEAVARFLECQTNIHLVILDVVMPKRNGLRVFEDMKEKKPDLKVLFMSGYVSDSETRREIAEKGYSFLSKPLSMEELLNKLREELDRQDT